MASLYPRSGRDGTLESREPVDGLPIDRTPTTLSSGDSLRDAIGAMARLMQPAIPVIHVDGRYLGLCTLRAIADMCLPIAGTLMTMMPSAAFMADGPDDARRRIEGRLDESVAGFIDASAPTLGPDAAASTVLVALFERHTILPVVDRGGRLIGVVHWNDLLERITNSDPANDQ